MQVQKQKLREGMARLQTLVSATVVLFFATQFFLQYFLPSGFFLRSQLANDESLFLHVSKNNAEAHHHHHHHHHKDDHETDNDCDQILPPINLNQSLFNILIVDQHNCGNFSTVQAAVNAVPDNSPNRTVIFVTSGEYREKVMVGRSKAGITLQGQGFLLTTIVWNDTANSSGGTFYSGSVSVFAPDFVAKDISFKNSAPAAKPGDEGGQAVAIRVAGDRAAFYDCGFYGAQDTLHDDRGRHYYSKCFIKGSIDFIFGNARSLFQDCVLSSIADPPPAAAPNMITGAITAQGRASANENSGFSFLRCVIAGTGNVWLGRAWRPYSTVVYLYSYMSSIVSADGWNDWNDPSRDSTIFYGQYKCWGPGAVQTLRVAYSRELNQTEACPFLDISFINGEQWLFPATSPYLSAAVLASAPPRSPFDHHYYQHMQSLSSS